MSGRASRGTVVGPLDQAETRRRIVARGRDLCLSPGQRAPVTRFINGMNPLELAGR
jgi:hypothetical protein